MQLCQMQICIAKTSTSGGMRGYPGLSGARITAPWRTTGWRVPRHQKTSPGGATSGISHRDKQDQSGPHQAPPRDQCLMKLTSPVMDTQEEAGRALLDPRIYRGCGPEAPRGSGGPHLVVRSGEGWCLTWPHQLSGPASPHPRLLRQASRWRINLITVINCRVSPALIIFISGQAAVGVQGWWWRVVARGRW